MAPISINGTTGISGVDGSAGTPALQGSDTNTGIAFGSDVIIGSTGGTERFRCDSSGRMLVGTTTATANGGVLQVSNGITFPATQSACSDANTLDDYEEGTWTPTLTFSNGSVGITYANRAGLYTKIGNIITVSCYLELSNKGSSTGNAQIESLPFPASIPSYPVNAGWVVLEGNGSSWPAAATYGLAWSDSKVYVRYNGAGGWSPVTNTSFTNTTAIYFSSTYRVS